MAKPETVKNQTVRSNGARSKRMPRTPDTQDFPTRGFLGVLLIGFVAGMLLMAVLSSRCDAEASTMRNGWKQIQGPHEWAECWMAGTGSVVCFDKRK